MQNCHVQKFEAAILTLPEPKAARRRGTNKKDAGELACESWRHGVFSGSMLEMIIWKIIPICTVWRTGQGQGSPREGIASVGLAFVALRLCNQQPQHGDLSPCVPALPASGSPSFVPAAFHCRRLPVRDGSTTADLDPAAGTAAASQASFLAAM